jgi:hypothetical protein
MKNKLKSLVALTASVLALSACVAPFSAFASDPDPDTATINQDSVQQAGDCEVNYTKPEPPAYTYTVIIPASVTITGDAETDKCTIRAEDVYLSDELPKLRIGVSSANYEKIASGNETHRLKLVEEENYIPYSIKIGEREVYQMNYVLLVDTGTSDEKASGSAEMCFALKENTAPAGNYKDILTFTVSCVDSNADN